MIDTLQDWLTEHSEARLLLAAYADREALLPKRSLRSEPASAEQTASDTPRSELPAAISMESDEGDSADGLAEVSSSQAESWIPRLRHVDGLDDATLAKLHGGLIAHGYLRYELFVKQGGLRYRLTPEGRRAASETIPDSTSVLTSGEEHQVRHELAA